MPVGYNAAAKIQRKLPADVKPLLALSVKVSFSKSTNSLLKILIMSIGYPPLPSVGMVYLYNPQLNYASDPDACATNPQLTNTPHQM